jgi:hypothetical protein
VVDTIQKCRNVMCILFIFNEHFEKTYEKGIME